MGGERTSFLSKGVNIVVGQIGFEDGYITKVGVGVWKRFNRPGKGRGPNC